MFAEIVVDGVVIYAVVGLAFAVVFAMRGAAAIDPVARHASWGFRAILIPGAALLWPVLAVRWWHARAGSVEVPGDRTDRWQTRSEGLRGLAFGAWIALAPLIALILVIALRARPGQPEVSRDASRLPAAEGSAP